MLLFVVAGAFPPLTSEGGREAAISAEAGGVAGAAPFTTAACFLQVESARKKASGRIANLVSISKVNAFKCDRAKNKRFFSEVRENGAPRVKNSDGASAGFG
jgi:hypothetical protein